MNLLSVYSIPIWQTEFPNFEDNKKNFLEKIFEYKEENKSILEVGNNSYESPKTLLQVKELEPLYSYFCNIIFKAIRDLDFVDCGVALTSSWVNINAENSFIEESVCGEIFRGIFCLKISNKNEQFVLKNTAINPLWEGIKFRGEKNQFTAEKVSIDPEEGGIILFPSYVPFSVIMNNFNESGDETCEESVFISFTATVFQE